MCIKGQGDPSVTLDQLKAAVTALNVKEISSLLIDSSLFTSSYYGGGQPFSGSLSSRSLAFSLSLSFSLSLFLSLSLSLSL